MSITSYLQTICYQQKINKGGIQIMRLANGIVIDKEKTFGVLKFSALRREVHVQNEDGTVSEEIKERTYDLKCNTQGRMIQVSVPATVPLKDYDYNARKKAQSDEIDRILDKLKKSGYESLTTEEKKSLFDASKR